MIYLGSFLVIGILFISAISNNQALCYTIAVVIGLMGYVVIRLYILLVPFFIFDFIKYKRGLFKKESYISTPFYNFLKFYFIVSLAVLLVSSIVAGFRIKQIVDIVNKPLPIHYYNY